MLRERTQSYATERTPQEDALIDRVAKGDKKAFRAIIECHGPWVFGATQVILGDRAMALDIVEETMLELWDHPGMFKASTAPLRDSLKVIARFKAVDEIRSLYDANAASRRSAAAGRSSSRYVAPKPSRFFGREKALPA
jgi:RNA polymerase sigma-70 factor (ECF subfamily)